MSSTNLSAHTRVRAFGRPMTTICSSTLEMGIDIGAVRMVGQIGAPWSVASFKQRQGRSGRRDDEPGRLRRYVICETSTEPDDPLGQIPLDLLQTIAVCELMLKKWIEPPQPATLDMSTLTHQVISTIAEVGAIAATDLHTRLCREGPFRAFTPPLFARVLRDLGAKDVIEQGADGKLLLGLLGEQLRASRDFYAAFASKVEYTVVGGGRAIGTLPMDTVPKEGEHVVLAARRWQVTDVDPIKRVLEVVPARRRQRPLFTGGVGEVHAQVREEMRTVLAGTGTPIYLDAVASEALAQARDVARQRGLADRGVIELDKRRCLWLTWDGARHQRTLLAWLASIGVDAIDRRVAIECKASPAELMMHLRSLADARPDLHAVATFVSPTRFRKCDDLLSEDLLATAIARDHLCWHDTPPGPNVQRPRVAGRLTRQSPGS